MKARICGKSVELPKLTLSVTEMLEELDDMSKSAIYGDCKVSDVYRKQYDILNTLVGEEATAEILLGDSVDEIDIQQLEIALIEIRDAYERPISDRKCELMKGQIKPLDPTINAIDKVASIAAVKGK